MSKLVQYVIVRHDILKEMQWPMGAFVAQACHATTAVMQLFKDDPQTQEYLSDLENMTKVVLDVPNEDALLKIAKTLEDNGILHKVWIEQPENMPTCIALKPYTKEQVKPFLGLPGSPGYPNLPVEPIGPRNPEVPGKPGIP